jgi:hypothetical protein
VDYPFPASGAKRRGGQYFSAAFLAFHNAPSFDIFGIFTAFSSPCRAKQKGGDEGSAVYA